MKLFRSLFTFYGYFMQQDKWKFFALSFMPIIWCCAETFAPYLIKILLDRISVDAVSARVASVDSASQDTYFLLMMVVTYITLIAAVEISLRVSNYLNIQILPKIKEAMRSKVLEIMGSYPYSFFQSHQAGGLLNDLKNLVDSFEQFHNSFFYGFYPITITFLISLFLISTVSKIFAGIFAVWYLGMNLITFLFLKPTLLAFNTYAQAESKLWGFINDLFRNSLAVKVFPTSALDQDLLKSLQSDVIESSKTAEWTTFKADTWRGLISFLFLSIMFVFLVRNWQKGLITLGDFAFITTICLYIRRSIWMAAMHLLTFSKYAGIAKQAFKNLIKDYAIDQGHLKPMEAFKKGIRFTSINFGYEQDAKIYQNFNLQIPHNQKIGIMGPSGTGKTTLIHLLLKLMAPETGQIYLGNYNLKDINSNFLRENISYVPQSTPLFHRTIYDNIHYGNPAASKEKVMEAAKACLCHQFISKLELGYDTVIGEDGIKLSGGQRQRIALARVYLKNSPIIILDEATSALDSASEQKVLQLFLNQKKTVLIISHRPSALLNVDRLIILSNGKIIKDGDPKKLL